MKKLFAFLDNILLKYAVIATLVFVPWYPKLPSVHIVRTWVYIRLEDFLIAGVVLLFLAQLLRRKTRFALPVGMPIFIYWAVGLCSLLFSLFFIGPHLVNFFPHLAILEYFRRIEYMALFFVAYASITKPSDIKHYIVALCVVLAGIVLYGFGQKYYIHLWSLFPTFFEKYSFCFPSFQTGNEEFAKGLPLCLPEGARITSTFGGHYDLAGYLVIVLPILLGVFFAVKKKVWKLGTAILFILSLMLLLFTASRVSFFAYLIGAVAALILMGRKKWILPIALLSVLLLVAFSGSTAKRLFETFRVVTVVTNNKGEVVGVAAPKITVAPVIPESLKAKIAKQDTIVVAAPPPTQNLPTGSSFITLPQTSAPQVTTTAVVTTALPTSEAKRLKLQYGGLQISTVSGSFLVQKALVYDISFTTRFQAEWPSAWAAFMSNPPLGKGYSTITLASDNDYLRLLGETGFLGFASFALIFIVLGIYLQHTVRHADTLSKFFALGVAGGVSGLFFNAVMIDVFEASKVAEPLWIFLGIAAGTLSVEKATVPYLQSLKAFVFSRVLLCISFFIPLFIAFGAGLTNFLVADDFTWLKWASITGQKDFKEFFLNAHGFFYRPIDKIVMYFLYSFFSFQPQGYRLFAMGIHLAITSIVFVLGLKIFKSKLWGYLLALLFLVLPSHAETLFWMSTISISFSGLFIMLSVFGFVKNREKTSVFWYVLSVASTLLALFSYEGAIVLPLLLMVTDILLLKTKQSKKSILLFVPYVLSTVLYLFARSQAHVVGVGGDYAYNAFHFIPNVVGNFLGYGLTAFTGERTLSLFNNVRMVLKTKTLMIGVAGLAILIAGAYFIVKQKVQMNFEKWRVTLLGLSFAFISLLPFLGLGAMSERYVYIASFGFVLAAVAALKNVYQSFSLTMWKKMGLAVGVVIAVLFFMSLIERERLQWKKAGLIAAETVGYFRVEKPNLPIGSRIYVVNLPTRIGNAWIFPVGLSDALWFVYKDPTLVVTSVKGVDEAVKKKTDSPSVAPAVDLIVSFDKNYDITEVKMQ